MKNNKGITLVSLVIYIALVFVVTAVVIRITTYFSGNIKDISNVNFETEFNKLNLYLITEAKTTGNEILEIANGSQITFSNGNKYTYNEENQTVYLNDTIKICEDVENCSFEQKIAQNGKSILLLTITINEITKTAEYVMEKETDGTDEVNMQDYLWGGSLASYYLKAGDYVDYTPDIGTYKVADGANGSGRDTTDLGYQEFTTETGDNALKWRVLSIDEKTGKIELVSAISAQSSTPLYLQGANGYNHSVEILNDLCETLYSKTVNGTRVATGRSINVEDINAKTTFDPTTYTNYGTVFTPYVKQYPDIYAIELGSTAKGLNETTKLLNVSEGVEKGKVNAVGVTEYSVFTGTSTASTLYATQTWYSYKIEDYLSTNLGINTSPAELLNVGTTGYLLASRCVGADNNSAYFSAFICKNGGIAAKDLFHSGNADRSLATGVRPIVSLQVDLLDFSAGDGSEENPWGMK